MKKAVLVTGASSGMGEDAVERLFNQGFTVYAAARRVERMQNLKKQGARVLHLDVTQEKSMQECIQTILDESGRLDVLVNNAGYGSYGALEDVPMEEAKKQFEVNVFGLARLTQLALPQMRKQNSGCIINVSSVGGKVSEPHASWYHATKFAVEGLSDCLRQELQPFNIRVVVIQPGAIKTEWSTIARQNMLKTSGHSAYGSFVRKHEAFLAKMDEGGSNPSVIGKTILKICTTNKPKTRYTVGKNAKAAIFIRALLSDKLYDKMVLGLMR